MFGSNNNNKIPKESFWDKADRFGNNISKASKPVKEVAGTFATVGSAILIARQLKRK